MVTIRKPKNALKFRSASGWWGALWREALPAGNGMIGAAVNGGAAEESIMLTHSNCVWQGKNSVLQDVSDKLKEVRKHLEDGEPKKAQDILSGALITKNYRPQVAFPLPVCDLKVKMPLDKPEKDYMRVVNMENGEVSVCFRDGATRFERSLFVSRTADTVVYELTKSGNKTINCKLSFDLHDRTNSRTPLTVSKLPERADTKYENYYMYFAAKSDDGSDFGAVAKVSFYGGSQRVAQDGLEIVGANSVLVLVKLFVQSQREKDWKSIKTELTAVKLSYDKLLKEHAALHSKLYLSSELNLEAKDRDAFCEDLISKCRSEDTVSSALAEKMWGYARYLFVSSTRENGIVMNPCGLWCGDYRSENPQAASTGELQMLYSLANTGNLGAHMNALFDQCERYVPDFKKNAQRLFNSRGIVLPVYTSPNTGLPGTVESEHLHYVAGAGWIANLFYDWALSAGDKKLMKERVVPFMREVAAFYEDFFKLGRDGKYRSMPSYSPDNTPGNYKGEGERLKLKIAADSTLDFAVAKKLLSNLVSECGDLKSLAADVEKWKDMLSKLPDYRINADGAAAEYVTKDYEDNYEQRLSSHLYPLYAGEKLDEEQKKAFLTAAKKRFEHPADMTSLGWGYLALAFAKLGESACEETCLINLIKYTAMNNLATAENDWRGSGFTNGNPWAFYNLSGNVGFNAALTAGYADGTGDYIRILPAPAFLPDSFELENVTLPGAEVSLYFSKGNLSMSFKAKKAKQITVRLPDSARKIVKPNNLGFVLTENRELNVDLSAGKAFVLEIKI